MSTSRNTAQRSETDWARIERQLNLAIPEVLVGLSPKAIGDLVGSISDEQWRSAYYAGRADEAKRIQAASEEAAGTPSKRAVNAFMAFRSYYSTIFEHQQKERSGRLTVLWQKEPYKNKWALMARLYSFVRDEVGKAQAPMAMFLAFACPAMGIVGPAAYLDEFHWMLEPDRAGGAAVLAQTASSPPTSAAEALCTEAELLVTVLANGYPLAAGAQLLRKLAARSSGVMTAGPASASPQQQQQQQPDGAAAHAFIRLLRDHPQEGACRILGLPPGSSLPTDVHVVWEDCDGVNLPAHITAAEDAAAAAEAPDFHNPEFCDLAEPADIVEHLEWHFPDATREMELQSAPDYDPTADFHPLVFRD